MGMDAVELVMALEETFGIEFDDGEAEACRTPREMVKIIAGKVHVLNGSSPCLSQTAFYRLRRAMTSVLGAERRSVRLSTSLARLIGVENRRTIWSDIRKSMAMQDWPELVRPAWLVVLIWLIAVSTATLAAWSLRTPGAGYESPELTAAVALIALAVVAAIGFRLTRRQRTSFPGDCLNVRALIRHILVAMAPRVRNWAQDDIATTVRSIVELQTGRTDFSLDSDFIRDIGLC